MGDYWEDNGITKPQQHIVCAACECDGVIILGARHWDDRMRQQYQMMLNSERWKGYSKPPGYGEYRQGFIDQFGDFLTREEALKVVRESGQAFDEKRNGSSVKLFSEGLY